MAIPTRKRDAITLIETLVSLSLLATAITVTAQMIVKQSRLQSELRLQRVAADELSNRLEMLTCLSADEVDLELEAWHDQPLPRELMGARVRGEQATIDVGRRITLTIDWPRARYATRPIVLVGWCPPDAQPRGTDP